jgi:DNA repair ATPase RecN|tara:strand:+ start:106 stop:531 length:426 start_codon:yes stop_codon:yes gene_type:complete
MNESTLHSQPAGSIGVLPDLVGVTSQGTTPFMAMRIHSATNKIQNKENNMSILDNNTEIFNNLPPASDLESELENVRSLVDDIGAQLEDKVRMIESVKDQIDSDFSAAEDAIGLLINVSNKLEALDTALEEVEVLDIDISI